MQNVVANLIDGDRIALLQLEAREQRGAVGRVHHRLLGEAERVGFELGHVLGPAVDQAQHAGRARPCAQPDGKKRKEERPSECVGARLPLFAPILHD